jgi:hypothetical protein
VIPEKVAAAVVGSAKMAEEKMIVMVDLSGAEQTRQVLVLTDLSGSQVDLSGVTVSLTQAVLPSEQVKEWASVEAVAVTTTQESEALAPVLAPVLVPVLVPVPAPADDKKEDTPQS